MLHEARWKATWFVICVVSKKILNRKHNIVNEKLQALTSNFPHTSFPVHFKVWNWNGKDGWSSRKCGDSGRRKRVTRKDDDDDDDDDEEPPKGREEVHTVHQHTHAYTYAPKQTHVVEKEGKKRLFALCTTSSHMHTHICTKHTCLKRKKKGCERVCFFCLWVNDWTTICHRL